MAEFLGGCLGCLAVILLYAIVMAVVFFAVALIVWIAALIIPAFVFSWWVVAAIWAIIMLLKMIF